MEARLKFGGFYNTEHSFIIDDYINTYFGDDSGNLPTNIDDIYWEIDWKKFKTLYSKELVEFMNDKMNLDLKFIQLWQPREYNFYTDEIDVEFTKSTIFKAVEILEEYEMEEDYYELIEKYTTSRDGYIPYYTKEEFSEDEELMMGVYLELIFEIFWEEFEGEWYDYIDDLLWQEDMRVYVENWIDPIYEELK